MVAFAIHAFLLAAAFANAAQETNPRTELPIQAPDSWESREQNSTLLLTPKDLAAGQVYTVLVPGLPKKVGTVRGLLDVAKATLGQVGVFKPANEPAGAKTEGGWEFEVVIGTLMKDGKGLAGQALGLRKDEKEGIILVLSDSVATMQKYSDAFNAMVRSLGRPKAALAETPPAGPVDLVYTVPEGWKATPQGGAVVLSWSNEATKGPSEILHKYQLIILPSLPLKDGLRKTFLDFWAAQMSPMFETSIMPLPAFRRLKSGAICACDVDDRAKVKQGETPAGLFSAGLYVLAQGKRAVPIIAFFVNKFRDADAPLLAFMESARIPNAGDDAIVPFTATELPGEWEESSMSMANYVSGGRVVGDASIFVGSTFTLNAEGTFKFHFVGIGRGQRVVDDDEGKWSVEDTTLTLDGKQRKRRYTVFGFGGDPKVGRFLVLSIYDNNDMRLDLGSPRDAYQSKTYKKKD
jgi:hypothetical protein